jgi:hypothetical protein
MEDEGERSRQTYILLHNPVLRVIIIMAMQLRTKATRTLEEGSQEGTKTSGTEESKSQIARSTA